MDLVHRRVLWLETSSHASCSPSPAGRRSFPFLEGAPASPGPSLHSCPLKLGQPPSASPWPRAVLSRSKTMLGTQINSCMKHSQLPSIVGSYLKCEWHLEGYERCAIYQNASFSNTGQQGLDLETGFAVRWRFLEKKD